MVLISVFGIQTYSQNTRASKEYEGRRHKGFYLSYAPGINTTNVKMIYRYGTTSSRGIGTGMELEIGGTLKENLVLHATIIGRGVYEPKMYGDGVGVNGARAKDTDLGEFMLGAGITYYTPENFLISTSLGMGGFSATSEERYIDISSDPGFSIQFKVGKEWWVLPKIGLGLGFFYHYTNVLNQKGSMDEERLIGDSVGIVLSTTLHGRE